MINLRTTLGDLKTSDIPAALGLCATDDRIPIWANEAQLRLLPKGKWWGTVGKFNIAATQGVLAYPREVAVIERVTVARRPVPLHDFWFEFLDNGYGTRDETKPAGQSEADFRGRFPTIVDITGTGNHLRFKCDVNADVGTEVLVLGHDDNGNWIRSEVNGVWQDGELIALSQTPGTLSINVFADVAGVQFPHVMNGQSWLYFEDFPGSQTLLGNYQYNELRPSYARYFFPSILAVTPGTTILVEALAKLEFIPALKDSDYLIIGCLPALKEEMMSINKKRKATTNADYQLAMLQSQQAVMYLEEELDHYLGTGRRIGINAVGAAIGDAEPIFNPL